MKKQMMSLVAMILVVGGVYVVFLTKQTLKMVAPDSYIVWKVTQRHDGDDSKCTTTVYRYAVQQDESLKLVENEDDCSSWYRLLSTAPTPGLPPFIQYNVQSQSEPAAVDLNGNSARPELGMVEGGGFYNAELGITISAEYEMPADKTFVSFSGGEHPPSPFVIDNAKEISGPLYLSPIAMSDDGTQVYLGTFTEASYRLQSGVPLFVYDVATGKISQVEYGRDLVTDEFVIDTANKRLLIVSGTRFDPPEGYWEVVGPSRIHLVDLVTGKGIPLELETTDQGILHNPRFSPVDKNTISAESNGVIHVETLNQDGTIMDGNEVPGTLVDWTKQMLVSMVLQRYTVFDSTSKQELGSVPQTPQDMRDGALSINYLGSVLIEDSK